MMNFKERIRNKALESDSKIIYETEDDFILAQFFKDTIRIGGNVVQIDGKGILNNTISAILMDKLDMVGIENHYIEKINMREQLIQAVDIIPVKVFVTNIAYGRYVQDFGIEEGYVFDRPMLDFQVKNIKTLHPINEEQLVNFGWMGPKEMKVLKNQAYRVNDFLTGLFAGVGLRLVQIKLEFGRIFNGENFIMMLAGEISPETCVLLNLSNNEHFSLDFLVKNIDEISSNGLYIYQEVAKRLTESKLLTSS
jgi:phosphoribosylaminoimidazole-succinocarboxamide synthase